MRKLMKVASSMIVNARMNQDYRKIEQLQAYTFLHQLVDGLFQDESACGLQILSLFSAKCIYEKQYSLKKMMLPS